MREYPQAELDELVACRKVIADPPRREMRTEGSQRRNDMLLRSEAGDREFRVFMRVHDEFNENFSIGLVYLPKDGSGELVLLRCNGPHGEFNRIFDPSSLHTEFHVHRATEQAIRAGLRAEQFASRSSQYASYREALAWFVREVNIDPANYFPDSSQEVFPFEEPEPPAQ